MSAGDPSPHSTEVRPPINWIEPIVAVLMAVLCSLLAVTAVPRLLTSIQYGLLGERTTGVVTDVAISLQVAGGEGYHEAIATYQYQARNGTTYTGRQWLVGRGAPRIKSGDQIPVHFLWSMPQSSRIGINYGPFQNAFNVFFLLFTSAFAVYFVVQAMINVVRVCRWVRWKPGRSSLTSRKAKP